MGTPDFKKKDFKNFRYEKCRSSERQKKVLMTRLSMQISNYFNEEEKKADMGRKWHNYAENFIISTQHKKTCTENGEEDR